MDPNSKLPERSPAVEKGGRRGAPSGFMTFREAALVGVALVFCQFAIGWFEEWRHPLQWLSRVLAVGAIAFFTGRGLWRWFRGLSTTAIARSVWLSLACAVVGWIDLALARGVAGMSEGNYALIVIGPLMMMLGALVSLAGLVAAGVATVAVIRYLSGPSHGRAAILLGGIAAVVLNLTPILLLVKTFEGH